ncbi:MAG: hypothetical protein DRK00_05085 [Thermoprotei archaeon]|nr:MAG: hypothetical protein DRK00_05085 [Thermoprotei archaeon]
MSWLQRKGALGEVVEAEEGAEERREEPEEAGSWSSLEEVMRGEGSDVEKALRLIGVGDLFERIEASRSQLKRERDRLRREIEELERKAEFLDRVIRVLDELEKRLRG